jgi:hypothetical protein
MTQIDTDEEISEAAAADNESSILQDHSFLICVHLCHLWTTLPINRIEE